MNTESPPDRTRRPKWSNAAITAALRQAQTETGKVVSERVYRDWLAGGGTGPSLSLLHYHNQNSGESWKQMLRRRGLRYGGLTEAPVRESDITADVAAAAFARYMAACDETDTVPSASGYQRWATANRQPSRIIVQRRLGTTWNGMIRNYNEGATS